MALSAADLAPHMNQAAQRASVRFNPTRKREFEPEGDGFTEEEKLVQHVRQLFELAKDEKRKLLNRWRDNYRMLFNRVEPIGHPDWQTWANLPEIFPIQASLIGWMTDQRFVFEVGATAEPNTDTHRFYNDKAEDLETLLNTSFHIHDEEAQLSQILWDAHTYGTGFTKTVWDPKLAGGLGDATFRRVDPFTLYPDPNARNMEQCDYLIEVYNLSLQALDRRFPGSAAKLLEGSVEDIEESPTQVSFLKSQIARANPGAIAPATSNGRFGPPGRQRSPKALPFHHHGVTVYEAWLRDHEIVDIDTVDDMGRPKKRKTVKETWRVVVIARDMVLADFPATELFEAGTHPYDRYVLADIGEFWGPSLVELLSNSQRIVNRLLTSILRNVDLVGNPVLIEPSTTGTHRTKTHNKPGERLQVSPAAAEQMRWLNPPSLHAGAADTLRYILDRMEAISGLSGIARGRSGNRDSQGTAEQLQEASFVRVRMALRELERTMRGIGTKKAGLIVANYTQPRMQSILGPDGVKTHMALRARHFQTMTKNGSVPMEFNIKVDAGSQAHTSRQAKEEKALTLFGLGAIDDVALLEAVEFPNYQEVAERNQQKQQAAGMAEAMRKGKS